jgi:hypothetical protein
MITLLSVPAGKKCFTSRKKNGIVTGKESGRRIEKPP